MKSLSRVLPLLLLVAFASPAAAASPALQPALDAFAKRDFKKVITLTEPLAAKGDPDAELLLGMAYFVGPEGGLPESDLNKAQQLFWGARDKRPEAAYALAILYQQGFDEVPPKVLGEAILRAAAMGSPGGRTMLGTTLAKGLPPLISHDDAESEKYLKLGAAGGCPDAFFTLGLMYENYRFRSPQPLVEAYKWMWRDANAPIVEPLQHPLDPSHWHRASSSRAKKELAAIDAKLSPQDLAAARRLVAPPAQAAAPKTRAP